MPKDWHMYKPQCRHETPHIRAQSMLEPNEKMQVKCSTTLRLNSPKLGRNETKYSHLTFDLIGCDFDVKEGFKNNCDHEVEKFCCCIWV